ncbi:alpha/beta fold hydrolase [Actinoplanes solisilvae]|uniref:alpha/beta fold hydrolase n=1 Tax=Actinoplanes solisilvae TaxID=2486853 RepID=UPI000FDAEC59|nr:alpha/beta hydrolase [Actinoplanes solisilvae]
MSPTRRTVLAGAAATGALAAGLPATAASASRGPRPTIVLVHGAFADASGWHDVARSLQRDGYTVIAPANPLRSVPGDSAYLRSILATLKGPLVLVGHSYGGFVITNASTGNANVKALVYIAAFAPDQGDTVGGLAGRFPGSRLGPPVLDIRPYPGGADGYIKTGVFREIFAGDLPRGTADFMAASQRPGDLATFDQKSGAPGWKTIPSWFQVSRDDQVIPAAAQRFMAKRAKSHISEVDASHVAMISQPRATTRVIIQAAR